MSKPTSILHLARLEKAREKEKESHTIGIVQEHAYAFSRTRKGGWAIAQLRSTSRKPKFKY